MDIASTYFKSGDASKALEWIHRVPQDEGFQAAERDELLLKIFMKLKQKKEQEKVAWRMFRRRRSQSTLKRLLDVIGQEKREEVIAESLEEIVNESSLSHSSADFIIAIDRLDDAEKYLMDRKDQLDGNRYPSMLSFVEAMENSQRHYAASIIYRALIDSVLARAKSVYYHHGIRYLKKLVKLSNKVDEWHSSQNHGEYLESLRKDHFRKRAFWAKYNT